MSTTAEIGCRRSVDTVDNVDMAAKNRFGTKRKRPGKIEKYVQPYKGRR